MKQESEILFIRQCALYAHYFKAIDFYSSFYIFLNTDVQFRIQGRLIDEKFFIKKITQITGNVTFLIRLVYQTRTRRRMYKSDTTSSFSVDRTGATWAIDQSGSLICRSPPSEIFPRNRAGSPVQTSRRKRTRHTRWRVHFAACNCTAITATRSSV